MMAERGNVYDREKKLLETARKAGPDVRDGCRYDKEPDISSLSLVNYFQNLV